MEWEIKCFNMLLTMRCKKETGAHVLIDPLFGGTSLRKYRLDDLSITMTDRLVSSRLDYILESGPRNGRRFKDRYRNHLIDKRFIAVSEKKIMHYDDAVMK